MTALSKHIRERIEVPNIWYVATVDADGAPHVSPMWVGLEGDLVFFNTAVGRVKERNLRRDPRVCLSHAHQDDPYDRVQIRGRVVRFVEGPEADRNMDRLAVKYVGTERFEWGIPGERRVVVFVEPTKVRHVVGVEPLPPGAPGAEDPPAPGRRTY
ncbi:PPOX class probable F420-dependent enzyme [Streptomyces griseochromogenes]|uniref:PPOX class F420-dependent enzyme n=1 Tax=Streptomyces griseochromogenes TaxID=68214 RepID=A0A1B1AYD5_9ACTN|nr:PPOX class F420-dependent oxidoreductase [Streptomyces griseochromogenes]ANP51588.1 PPOX class F420-dependent enzyme [Streptomyces griseochromogenes]MBP2054321.1 PPOX class probable F420-dependent enzyme [Streptomyces griseochromogenes]